jgi:hypothetical protein
MDHGLFIARIDLKDQLPTPSARRQDPSVTGYRDDLFYLRLSMFQHLGDRGMLGAESDTTASIDADAGIDISFLRDERATNAAATRKLAQFPALTDFVSFSM